MLRVGVTGGIGSGKSTVCKILETLGYPVYYADIEAKKISDTDSDVIAAVSSLFGGDIYTRGKLDKRRVASIVFSNSNLLKGLNDIIHPAVAQHYESWAQNQPNASIVFSESAILFESGAFKSIDKVIAVIAPVETKITRVVKRDNTDRASVIKRMENQLPDQEIAGKSDFVVLNDDKHLLLPQVFQIIDCLLHNERQVIK